MPVAVFFDGCAAADARISTGACSPVLLQEGDNMGQLIGMRQLQPSKDGAVHVESSAYYEELIFAHHDLLDQLCCRAAQSELASYHGDKGCHGENEAHVEVEAGEFFLKLIDILRANDYRILRNQRPGTTLKGYLATVVATRYVDFARARRGRISRGLEKGVVARLVRELHRKRGLPASEIFLVLRKMGLPNSLAEVDELIEADRGHFRVPVDTVQFLSRVVMTLERDEGEAGFEVVDPRLSPEEEMLYRDLVTTVRKVLRGTIPLLTPRERYICVLLNVPWEGKIPTQRETAKMLGKTCRGLTEKAISYHYGRAKEKASTVLKSCELGWADLERSSAYLHTHGYQLADLLRTDMTRYRRHLEREIVR
jgi:hypothetical protein